MDTMLSNLPPDSDLNDPAHKKAIESAADQTKKIIKQTSSLSRRSLDFVAHDLLSQVGQDLAVLMTSQRELNESIESILPEQYRRRQMIIAGQMQEVATTLRQQAPVLRVRGERAANQWADWLDSQARKIRDVTGTEKRPRPAPEKIADRRKLAQSVQDELVQHQNIFNVDGAASQELLQGRKELREQTVEASQVLERVVRATRDLEKPQKSEEAEAEIAGLLVPAIEQLAKRREVQQARHDGDRQYIADLGESYRAAQALLRQRHTEPTAVASRLEELQKSVKVLEAIHEMEQTSDLLNQLQKAEQWRSNAVDSRFEQPRAWEATKQQMAQAIQTMGQAKLPKEAIATVQGLQRGEASQRVDSKIGPRRWSPAPTASAAGDIEDMRTVLREQLTALAPLAAEARKTLAEQTPSVSELARDAADRTREGVEATQELSQAIERDEVPELEPRVGQLQQKLAENEAPIREVREALADVASRQDLMKESHSQISKDADLSIGVLHQFQKKVRESVRDVVEADEPESTRERLDQSASVQETTARSLEQIADHFEALQKSGAMTSEGSNASPPALPSELADTAKEMARPGEMDRAHADAERLRRLASLDPKLVLEQLEKELVRNPPMQSELSQISKNAVESALNTLDFSADAEKKLDVAIENSDLDFAKTKEMLRSDLKRVADQARSLIETTVGRIRSTTDSKEQEAIRSVVDKLKNDLAQSLEPARNMNADARWEELNRTVRQVGNQLHEFRSGMRQQETALEQDSQKPSSQAKPNRRDRQRAMEDLQKKYRDEDVRNAFARERVLQQETTTADQEYKKAQQNAEKVAAELEKTKREIAELADSDRPDDLSRKAANEKKRNEQNQQLAKARAEAQAIETKRSKALERQMSAKTAREKIQLNRLGELDAEQPGVQLAGHVAASAADRAEELINELAKSFEEAKRNALPSATQQASREAAIDQEGLNKGVAEAGEALARAARHEERLSNPTGKELLDEQSQQVANLAQGAMQSARDQLSKTADMATSDDTTSATQVSQEGLREAESALREQAASLRASIVGDPLAQSQAGAKSARSGASGKAMENPQKTSNQKNSLLSPQEMAQMLDQLDQQLHAPPDPNQSRTTSKQESSSSPTDSQQASRSSKSGEPSDSAAEERAQSLAEAAERLAAEMNQQRQSMETSAKTMPIAALRTRKADRRRDRKSIVGGSDASRDRQHRRLGQATSAIGRRCGGGDREQILPPIALRSNSTSAFSRDEGLRKSEWNRFFLSEFLRYRSPPRSTSHPPLVLRRAGGMDRGDRFEWS